MTEPDGQDERERQQAVRLTVAQDGSGDYDTVGAALAALGDKDGPPACIFIKEGVYRERLEITRPWITLEGQSAGSTVITSGLSAGMAMEAVSGGPSAPTACWLTPTILPRGT